MSAVRQLDGNITDRGSQRLGHHFAEEFDSIDQAGRAESVPDVLEVGLRESFRTNPFVGWRAAAVLRLQEVWRVWVALTHPELERTSDHSSSSSSLQLSTIE